MYGLMGKLKAHAGQRDALIQHLMDGVKILRSMKGCYLYVISAATDDPDTVWITEVWEDSEAHRASLTNDDIRAVITAARPLIAALPDGFEIIPLGGVGLPEHPVG